VPSYYNVFVLHVQKHCSSSCTIRKTTLLSQLIAASKNLVVCIHHLQLEKVAGGIKVTTDKDEEFEADAVMFATGDT
jgi:gamma-glutamyl-gamma-aminobutyrate hydrolase PuuD